MLPDIVRRVDRRQPACRSALPQAAFLPRKNSVGLFGGGKPDDDKEEDAGILAYAAAGSPQGRKTSWGEAERRSVGGVPIP